MTKLPVCAFLFALALSIPASGQGLVYVLGGLTASGDATAENKTKLGIPVVELGLEAKALGPLGARLTVHYGFDWTLFKDPCADCEVPGVLTVDPAKNKKRPPIGLSGDIKIERAIGNRLALSGFFGIGLAQSQQGNLDPDVQDDYRVKTHTSSFATLGTDLAVNLYKRLDAVGRVRYAVFSTGEQEITMRQRGVPNDFVTQFTVENGTVSGAVLLFGVRLRPASR